MSILRKSLADVTIADLDQLIAAEARETDELEFKGTLPFVPTKGQPAIADRWIEKGDRVGDYARDQILAELVAFANADGGTLIVGLHETKDEPRRAESLEVLPNCEGLARRLLDAAEDVIEPRLPTINAKAIPANAEGSGYVIFRVAKSLAGPHRLTTTREFYVRRGERAARMAVREIKDYTLELARSADRLEAAFSERQKNAANTFASLTAKARKAGRPGIPPLVIRATAIPTTPQSIPDLTRRQELWWKGKGFRLKVNEATIDCGYPLRECSSPPRIRLRALVANADETDDAVLRLLRSDGAVEFSISHHLRVRENPNENSEPRIYVGWLVSLITGVICQVMHLRTRLAWDAVEFGLEIEIWSSAPLAVQWTDRDWRAATLRSELPLTLPRYSLAPDIDLDALITLIARDVFDACETTFNDQCSVPWADLAN